MFIVACLLLIPRSFCFLGNHETEPKSNLTLSFAFQFSATTTSRTTAAPKIAKAGDFPAIPSATATSTAARSRRASACVQQHVYQNAICVCECVCMRWYAHIINWFMSLYRASMAEHRGGGVICLRENELGHTRGVFALELAMYPGGYNLPFRQEMWM